MRHRVGGQKPSVNAEFILILILVMGLLLQVVAAITFPGYIRDQEYFIHWMHDVDIHGLVYFYEHAAVDYPPVYIFVLYVYGKSLAMFHLVPVPGAHILSKLPSILFYTLTDCFVYLATRSYGIKVRIWTLGLFALNPAILFDTAVWGQVDILDGALMLLTILRLGSSQTRFTGSLYALALASKFQSVAVAPVIAVFLLYKYVRGERKPLFRFVAETGITLVILFLPFLVNGGIVNVLQKAYIHTVGEYSSVSVGAMNIWYYLIGVSPDTSDQVNVLFGLTLRDASLCLLALAVVYMAYYLVRSNEPNRVKLLRAASFLCFSFFMLPTEIHERYNIPTVVICAMVIAYDSSWIRVLVGLTIACLVNLALVGYGLDIVPLGIAVTLVNVVLYVWMAWNLRKQMSMNALFPSLDS